jgi:hypothetical protein
MRVMRDFFEALLISCKSHQNDRISDGEFIAEVIGD